jgi:hypothetical protein
MIAQCGIRLFMRTQSSRLMPGAARRMRESARIWRLLALIVVLSGGRALALEPVDPEAGPEARALLAFLEALPDRATARVMSGQTIHGDLEAQYERYIEGHRRVAGVYPAMLQLMLHAHWLPERDHVIAHRADSSVFPLSYNHANAGGVVMWLYNPNNPFTGEGNKTPIPAGHSLAEAYTPGTVAHAVWREDLEMLAAQARRMERAGIPVIVRMFGEYNTAAVRWQNVRANPASTWEEFRAAWRHAVRVVRDAGAHNVLWCLEEADGLSRHRLLGWQEEWVDVAGIQALHDESTEGPLDLYSAYVNRSAKPVLYGQFLLTAALRSRPPAYHYDRAIALVRESMPRITAIVPWSVHEWGLPDDLREHSPVFHHAAREYAEDPWMLHRGGALPDFGRPGRAPLPIDGQPVAVSGAYADNFDGFDGGAAPWRPGANGSVQQLVRGDGVLGVFFFGRNPRLLRTGLDMPAGYDRLRLRLRNHSLAETVTLSWKRTTDRGWSDQRRVAIPVAPMGVYFEERRLDLNGHPLWNGTIGELRLDLNPGRVWGSAEIDFVKFDRGGGRPVTTLLNRGFESGLGVGWLARDRAGTGASLARYTRERRSGEYAGLVYLRDHPGDGMQQDVTDLLRHHGPGRYRFGVHAKLPDSADSAATADGRALLVVTVDGRRAVYKARRGLGNDRWRRVADDVAVDWDGELERAVLIVNTTDSTGDLLVDDLILKRVGDLPKANVAVERAGAGSSSEAAAPDL